MECVNPKVFRVRSPNYDHNGKEYLIFIPCGDCYACQCASRSEWVLRMREEFKDKRNVSSFFLTLTYDDEYLPVVGFNTKKILDYYSRRPLSERSYWFSVLNKEHASMFLESCKYWLRKNYLTPLYYVNKRTGEYSDIFKRGFSAVYDDNSLPRYFLTGEYGDLSLRAHMHAIVLFPCEIHKSDLEMFSSYLWPYGHLDIDDGVGPAAQNYIAKHQVKDCFGTPFQQLASPIFKLVSRYNGGLGRTLKLDDRMKEIWLNSLRTGDKSECFYQTIQSSIVYKVPIPRFLKREWHREKFDDFELSVLENESIKNVKKHIETCMLEKNDFSLYDTLNALVVEVSSHGSNSVLAEDELQKQLGVLAQPYLSRDRANRELYKRKKLNRKLQMLLRNKFHYNHI